MDLQHEPYCSSECDDSDKAMAAGMLRAYVERWRDEQPAIKVLHTEETFLSPLFKLPQMERHGVFHIAGKLDKIVEIDGRTVLVDHKTTSVDISDGGYYWRQLQIDSQHHHYELLLLANGIRLDGILWDVTRKPSIRQRTKRQPESLEEYSDRVTEAMQADPDKYFRRRYIHRTSRQLFDYAAELSQVADDIERCREEDSAYRNPGACLMYGSPCQYLGICSGFDTPFSQNWIQREETHAELDIGDGSNVLTNSRIRCWQTCRRKHHYRYELGIDRKDSKPSRALTVGTLWHDLLDTYWTKGEA